MLIHKYLDINLVNNKIVKMINLFKIQAASTSLLLCLFTHTQYVEKLHFTIYYFHANFLEIKAVNFKDISEKG